MTTTSQKQNPQKYSEPFHPQKLKLIPNAGPTHIQDGLRKIGCNGCELGQKFKPVVYRGNPDSRRMIIGEAPGLMEAKEGEPFVGPAGKLLDKIWAAVGWTTSDWYLTNVVKCRPVAPPNSGKQNLTPTKEHRAACFPYIMHEIEKVKPRIIVLLGKSAVVGMHPSTQNKAMHQLVGQPLAHDPFGDIIWYVMYHPAYILRQQNIPGKGLKVRQDTWYHIKKLKELVDELESID